MSIPYMRRVHYVDDGCDLFQCLMCYEKWESRGGHDRWNFCPFCGIKWNGQLQCRQSTTPRWMYEYEQQHGTEAIHEIKARLWNPPIPSRGWVIESRLVRVRKSGPVYSDWIAIAKHDPFNGPASMFRTALQQLVATRRDAAHSTYKCTPRIRTEFRARIADLSGVISSSLWRRRHPDTRPVIEIWMEDRSVK